MLTTDGPICSTARTIELRRRSSSPRRASPGALWASASGAAPSGAGRTSVMVVPGASYRITVNSFLADGGDNFIVLTQGTNRLGGAVDTDALEGYFAAFSPVAPGPLNRIVFLP